MRINSLVRLAAAPVAVGVVALGGALTPALAASTSAAPGSDITPRAVYCVSWAGGTDENHVDLQCYKGQINKARGVGDCNGPQPDIFTAWLSGPGWSESSNHCINGIYDTHVEYKS